MNNATVIKAAEIVTGDLIDFGDGIQRYILGVPERRKTVVKVEYYTADGLQRVTVKAAAKVSRY